jgi:hypothetical protein
MYVPGDYEAGEYRLVKATKGALYAMLVVCAVWWTIDASKPLDAVDAWLWLACFAVIELNVFGFDRGRAPAAPEEVAAWIGNGADGALPGGHTRDWPGPAASPSLRTTGTEDSG